MDSSQEQVSPSGLAWEDKKSGRAGCVSGLAGVSCGGRAVTCVGKHSAIDCQAALSRRQAHFRVHFRARCKLSREHCRGSLRGDPVVRFTQKSSPFVGISVDIFVYTPVCIFIEPSTSHNGQAGPNARRTPRLKSRPPTLPPLGWTAQMSKRPPQAWPGRREILAEPDGCPALPVRLATAEP